MSGGDQRWQWWPLPVLQAQGSSEAPLSSAVEHFCCPIGLQRPSEAYLLGCDLRRCAGVRCAAMCSAVLCWVQALVALEEQAKKKAEVKKAKYKGPMLRFLSKAVDGVERASWRTLFCAALRWACWPCGASTPLAWGRPHCRSSSAAVLNDPLDGMQPSPLVDAHMPATQPRLCLRRFAGVVTVLHWLELGG